MRASRSPSPSSPTSDSNLYLPSTAVVLGELAKILLSILFLLPTSSYSIPTLLTRLNTHILKNKRETVKMLVPSAIYAMQNNLLYTALTNLDAATYQVRERAEGERPKAKLGQLTIPDTMYQVSYQIKILTTAVFSVVMLRRSLSRLKWAALVLLLVGVALVQLQGDGTGAKVSSSHVVAVGVGKGGLQSVNQTIVGETSAGTGSVASPTETTTSPISSSPSSPSPSPSSQPHPQNQNRLLGLAAVLVSALTSGFAGCYFELILKSQQHQHHQPTTPYSPFSKPQLQQPQTNNIWIRNIQLALFTLSFSLVPIFTRDLPHILRNGFFSGYTPLTWVVILNQAVGGLLVSLVVKYADSIAKGFATSVSIVVSSVVAMVWMEFVPSAGFLIEIK
ncbi:hypothetical protein HK104_001971 [Borealophlyctis nickersoniae]|nr:hypothetical protein HK104_001971 [Borealophlyctis nickersoniae]